MAKLAKVTDQNQERSAKRVNIAQFLKTLEQSETLLAEFDEGLWYATVDRVTINTERDITSTFKDGTELPWKI